MNYGRRGGQMDFKLRGYFWKCDLEECWFSSKEIFGGKQQYDLRVGSV